MSAKFSLLVFFGILNHMFLYSQTSSGVEEKSSFKSEQKNLRNIQDSSYTIDSIFPGAEMISLIKISVVDKIGKPMMASINLRNAKNELIYSHLTDALGVARVYLGNTKGIKFLTIGWVGFERVYIPISKFQDIDCKLVVRLTAQEMEMHPGEVTRH